MLRLSGCSNSPLALFFLLQIRVGHPLWLLVMGLTKQYLRYAPSAVFGVIGSQKANIAYVTLRGGEKGRYVAVAACEHVFIWDIRKGEKVELYFPPPTSRQTVASAPNLSIDLLYFWYRFWSSRARNMRWPTCALRPTASTSPWVTRTVACGYSACWTARATSPSTATSLLSASSTMTGSELGWSPGRGCVLVPGYIAVVSFDWAH